MCRLQVFERRDLAGVSPPTCAGFSLLELLLVLAIAGLMALVVAPSFTGTLESARLRGGTGEVRATLALARTLAVSEAKIRVVAFNLDVGEYGIEGVGEKRLLPDGIRFSSVRLWGAESPRNISLIRFSPDGSADEAEIALSSRGGGTLRVGVDPLTGIAQAGT